MLGQILVVALVGLLCVAFVLLVFANHRVSLLLRISFACMALGVACWQIAVPLSNLDSSYALLLNRLVFVFPIVALVGLLFFSREVTTETRRVAASDVILAMFSAVIVSWPSLITGLTARTDASGALIGYDLIRGDAYIFFVLAVVLLGLMSVVRLGTHYRRSIGPERARTKIIFIGFLFALVIGITTNIGVPIVLGSSAYSFLGVIAGAVFVGSVAYSVAKRQFLDVRPVLLRASVYILSLILVALAYGTLGFLITDRLFVGGGLTSAQRYAFIALAIVLAASFGPLRAYFDRVTKRVFFRGEYDPQLFLAAVNKSLVAHKSIEGLLKNVGDIITRDIKSGSAIFAVYANKTANAGKLFGGDMEIPEGTAQKLYRKAGGDPVSLTDTDMLRWKLPGVEVVVPIGLSTRPNADQTYALLLLTEKRNGSLYSQQDLQVLKILAGELIIAIQNLLRLEEIERFNETLQQRVDNATSQLREANERLKVLDRNKDDFVSMASHQLRTPLTSVKGYLSMVLEGDAGKITDLQRKMIEQAFASSERMTYLISDLLNLSRLKTGKFVISASSVSLVQLVHQEIAQLNRMAEANGVEMVIDMPDDMPRLQLDETKTRQLIMNLVDNAIYYTPKGGKVTVRLKQTSKTIELRIIDTGIGVPKDEQHKLFTRFYRASNAKRRRPDGTGIGLYMVKKAVVAMGGSVIFDSTEGKGSTFGFSFPIKDTK